MANLLFESISPSHNLAATLENVCCCCLQKSEFMVNAKNCNHNEFIREHLILTMDYPRLVVCRNCHNMLKKIKTFHQQVQKSCEMLKQQVIPNKTNKLYYSLQHSEITFTSSLEDNIIKVESINEQDPEFDIKEESPNENSPFQTTTDVKIEHTESSDCENDLPLSQMKKPKKGGREQKIDENYEGKIGLLVMSKEEFMLEREKCSKQESYLKQPFKCESCIKGFDRESTFKAHNEKQHIAKKDGYLCDICKSYLGSELSYKEHTRRHLTRYICMACGKPGVDIHTLTGHYNKQHGNGDGDMIYMQFDCNKCDYTTHSHRSYRYHIQKQHQSKPECHICRKTYITVSSLKKHIEIVHEKVPPVYKCSTCGKQYRCKSGLFNHEATHAHGGTPAQTHYCAPCNTHFTTKSGLTHHLKTHSTHVTEDTKRFACNECDLKFITKGALKTHIVWEHLKLKHQCQHCSKAFRNVHGLKKHISYVHEKKRPPRNKICDHCGRGFTTTAILVSHIRTHTGDRPLRCSHCSATFAHNGALYTHNKLLHK